MLRLLIAILLTPIALQAQEGYRLDFRILGLKDTTAFLGYFLQEKTFIQDTAKVDRNGRFGFAGRKPLPQGVYFIVLDKTKIFDIAIGPDQQFSIETSTADYTGDMVVKGDVDNQLFLENLRFNTAMGREAEPFTKILRDTTAGASEKAMAREHLKRVNDRAIAHHQGVVEKYPATLTARLIRMNKPVAIPDPPKKADGTIDSTFQLHYYRKHYFDHFDLGDEAMLRVPKVFYWEKVRDYLDRLFVPHPDSVTKAIDGLVSVAKRNRDTYKYLVWNCLVHYQQHNVMGLDEVYVNLADKYIATGEMDYWLDKKTVKNVMDYADKVRRAMIGRIAPNVICQDADGKPRSLYDIRSKYTIILYFWTQCGHCREETPKLVEFYTANKKKFDIEVFAVATDTSMNDIRKFITEFKTPWVTVSGPRTYIKKHFTELYFAETTPTLYILDENKKIIARRLPIEQIGDFLSNHERMVRRKPPAESR